MKPNLYLVKIIYCILFFLISLTVLAQPVAMPHNTGPVCLGDSVTLHGNAINTLGPVTYQWVDPDGNIINSQNITIKPSISGNYTLSITATNGKDSDITEVIVNDRPNISIIGLDSSYCNNIPVDSITLSPLYGIVYDNDVLISSNVATTWLFTPSTLSLGNHEIKYVKGAALETPVTIFEDNFSKDKGWQGYDGVTKIWERGVAKTGTSCTGGTVDPSTDYSSTTDNYIIGNIIGGCYPLNQPTTKWLESPVIDCSNRIGLQITYYEWNRVGAGDSTFLEAFDGTSWVNIIKTGKNVAETNWTPVTKDLPQAENNPNFKIRFGFRPSTGLQSYPGMSIDELKIYGKAPNDCSDSSIIKTTIYPVPVVEAGDNQEICNGKSATLSATSTIVGPYEWSKPAFINPITVSPIVTTIYTVTVTAPGTCTATDIVTVIINNIPAAMITPNPATICNGSSVTLTASGGTSYSWNNGPVVATNTVNPIANTTYTVTITDAKTCSNTTSTVVSVNLSPTANADTDREICKGFSTSLTASYTGGVPGGTYLWNTNATTPIISVSPLITTTYTVTVTLPSPNECTSSDEVIITVNNPPTAQAGSDSTICIGNSTTLSANGGISYKWSNGALTQTTGVTPLITTTYTVTVTDAKTCTNTDEKIVFVNNKPLAAITPSPTTICSGLCVTLTGSGGNSYKWNNGPTISTNPVCPPASATYTVTVTDINTCTNTSSVAVTVNPSGTANAGLDNETCKGTATSLTATYSGGIPGGTYLWNTGGTNATISVTPLIKTTYTVTVTLPLPNGCTSSDEVIVTVNNLPTADAGLNKTICIGSSTTLSANGGINYKWSNGALTQTTVVTPLIPTTYTVTVTDAKTCTNTAQVVITPQALPIAAITDTSVCKGFSQTLTASGGTGFLWNTGETTASITDDPSATTTYTVTVSDALGCSDTEDGVITVRPNAPLAVIGNTTICPGSSATLIASGCNSYVWNTPATSPSITINPLITTTYTVTGTDIMGCTASANAIVTIGLQLIPATIADTTICKGSSIILTASPGPNYLWSNSGETTASITVSPTVKTTYTVTVNDGISCTGSTSVVVSIGALPTATIVASNNNICSGTNINLTASPAGQAYVWNIGAPTRINNQTPAVTTTYIVTLTETTNSCSDRDSIIIIVKPTPTVTALSDVTICTGGSTTLSSSLSAGTYLWNTGETTQSITSGALTLTTTYTLTYTKNGCSASDAAVVTIASSLIPDAGPGTAICKGASTQLQATGGTTYTWAADDSLSSLIISNPIATPAITTTYTVTVNDGICSGTDNVIITVNPYPTVEAGTSTTICKGDTTTINGSVIGIVSSPYKWVSGQTTQVITVTPLTTTVYTLTATNNGCSTSDNITITVNPLPTVIGINDTICSIHGGYIKATGADTYLWSTGETTDSVYKHPAISTTYTVTGTLDGCTASAIAAIIVNQTPTVNAGEDTAVCKNSTATLTVTATTSSGQINYKWSTLETTVSISKTPLVNTTYYIKVTDPTCGCTNQDTVVVTVNALPTANAGGNKQLCIGSTINLTGSGGDTYKWSPGDLTAIINVFPIVNKSYTLTVTDTNGCTATDVAIVTVNALPTADAGLPQEICAGNAKNLTATGGGTYNWSTSDGTSIISVTPALTTKYTVTVTSAAPALCTATDDVTITVNSIPTVTFGLDVGICLGGTSTLSPTINGGDGNYNYLWSPNSEITPTITVNPITKTTYSLLVTDGKTCSDSDDIIIDIVTELHPNLGPDTVVCLGGSINLNCSGYADYIWTPSTYLNSDIIGNPTCKPAITQTYTISVNDGVGCSGTDDIIITVNPLPTASAHPIDSSVCRGFPVDLSANGGLTYLWSDNGQTTNNITVTPVISNTYIVSVYNVFNCYDTASLAIHVFPDPPANAGKDTAICPGKTITLTANGGGSYIWSEGNKTTASINVAPIVQTIYYVTVTNLATGCTDYDSVIVSMNPIPTASITGDLKICNGKSTTLIANGGESYKWNIPLSEKDTLIQSPIIKTTYTVTAYNNYTCFDTETWTVAVDSTPTADAGLSISACIGKSITFTAKGGSTYEWSTNDMIATTTVSPNVTTTYTVTVAYLNGCTSTDTVVALMNSNPTVNLGDDLTVCAGGQTSLNPIASGGDNNYSYKWDDNSTIVPRIVIPPGISAYTITITDGKGCTNTDRIIIEIGSSLTPSITNDTTICAGSSIQLNAGGGVNYTWSNGLGILSNPTVTPLTTTTYTVSVDNNGNCSGTADVIVTVNTVTANASAVTPVFCNGDSTNLIASGGVDYLWSTTENAQIISVSPIITETYTLTAYDAIGCSNSDAIIITINNNPTINLGSNVGVCKDGSTILHAKPTGGDGHYTYLWSNLKTDSAFIYAPIDSTTFTVTVTDGNGCTDIDDIIIYIDSILKITITPDTSTCLNSSVQLNVSGGINYSWSPALGLSKTNIQNPLASPLSKTTYIVEVNDGNTCSATDTVIVSINTPPTANAGAGATVCKGISVPLHASGGTTYIWTDGTPVADAVVKPDTTTTYTVTVYDDNLCSDDAQVIVTIYPNPTVDLGSDIGICKDRSAKITPIINGGSGDNHFIWNNTKTTSSITVTPSIDSTYVVTVSDLNGCSDTDDILVFISTKLVLSIKDTFACANNCVQLILNGGGVNYIWSPSAYLSSDTIQNPIACPLANTTYTISVNDGFACTATASVVISINQLPTIDAGSSTPVCEGDIANLTASSNGNYLWATSETTAMIAVKPITSQWYTVTATNNFGCTDKDSVVVNVNPAPIVKMGDDIGICKNGSTIIRPQTSSGDSTFYYLWNDLSTKPDTLFTPIDSITIFSVTVTDGKGCTDSDDIIVFIDSVLKIQVTPDTSICFLTTLQLNVNGGLNYSWSPSISLNKTDIQNPLAAPLTETTYIVSVNDGGKCTAADTVIVKLNPIPTANAGTGSKICEGISVNLEASGGTDYMWDNSTPNAITIVTPKATTTYTVTVLNDFNCSDKDEVVVIVNPNPTVTTGPDLGICKDGSTRLTVSIAGGGKGTESFIWSNGKTTPEIIVTPIVETTYTTTVTDINDCSDSDDIIVTIGNALVVSLTKDTSVCANSCLQLLVNGGMNYLWSPPVNLDNIHIQNPISCPSETTTYIVTTDDGGLCSAIDTIVISINPIPTATVNYSKSTGSSLCKGNSTTLHAIGGTNYIWNNNDTTSSILITPAITTQYKVTVTNPNGCSNKDSINIIVHDLPVVSLGPNAGICINGSTNLTANASEGTAPYRFVWSTLETNKTITVSPSIRTTYTVQVTDTIGCTNSDDVIISLGAQLQPNAGADLDICLNDSIQLIVNGGLTYIWSPGASLSNPLIQNPYAKPIATTTYIVTASDGNICNGKDTVIVRVNELPTPNIVGNQKICLGTSVNLQASDGLLYEWNTGKTKESIIETPDTSTTYIVTATNEFGCTNQDDLFVRVSKPVIDLEANKVICNGSTATIIAVPNPVNKTYLWNTLENSNFITDNPIVNTTYTLTVTDSIGCTDSDDIVVTIQLTPQPLLLSKDNKDHYCVEDDASLFLNIRYYSYKWSTGSSTDKIKLNQTDNYLVTVTDSLGCTLYAGPKYITVDSIPIAEISDNEPKSLTVHFTNYSMSGVNYFWDFGDNNTSPQTKPIHTYSSAGEYFVRLTASNNCKVSKDSQWVSIHDSTYFGIKENPISEIISIYPNPTKDQITIDLQTAIADDAVITIYNMIGEQIHTEELTLKPGEQKINLSLNNQAKGMYTIQIRTKNNVMYARVMKE